MNSKIDDRIEDIASFNNLSPLPVMSDFNAAIKGHFNRVRMYGVIIHHKHLDGLTGRAKAKKILAMIIEQTKDAEGDYEKSKGSFFHNS